MTRKEAIAVLECLALEMNAILAGIPKSEATADQIKRCIDAYDMAISALRQQEHFREVTKKVEPLTNADRIRAMSDEELADFLAYTWATSARAWQKDPGETLHWLQQPAEEDDHE